MRAAYAVAADGVRSPVRHQLGIDMLGHGTFSDSITIYFRADVRPLLGERNLSVVYVVNPRLQGFFRFSFDGQSGFLVVNSAVDDEGQRTTTIGATATEADCVRYVREALGAAGPAGGDRGRAAVERRRGMGRADARRPGAAGR